MAEKRVSPVAVVDLTLESDDEEQEPRLGDVRKRLHSDSYCKNKKTKSHCADNVPVEYDYVLVIDSPPQHEDRKLAIVVSILLRPIVCS
eukprot:scaffold2442_cov146-Cylindrotheca_fusiformis.AAC.2